jgi:hypothetical protein
MSADTLVFIPVWNEEASLPDVLAEARRELTLFAGELVRRRHQRERQQSDLRGLLRRG